MRVDKDVGYLGDLPTKLREIVNEYSSYGHGLSDYDRISTTVYSYDTPIAWFHKEFWVIPEVWYSQISVKHQSYLYHLPNRVYIPADCSPEEYERVLDGKMRFAGGVTVPGALWVLE